MSEKPKHALWGQDTSRWRLWQHVFAWAMYVPLMAGVVWLARKITAWALPF